MLMFIGLRAYSDSREPHSLVSYVNKMLNEVKSGSSQRPTEALVDKRLPFEQYGNVIYINIRML